MKRVDERQIGLTTEPPVNMSTLSAAAAGVNLDRRIAHPPTVLRHAAAPQSFLATHVCEHVRRKKKR